MNRCQSIPYRNLLIYSVFVLAIMLQSFLANGQSPVFSQYYFFSSAINPAYTGLEKDLFLGMNHRSQWRNLQSPYYLTMVSGSFPFFVARPNPVHIGGASVAVSQESAGPGNLYSSMQAEFSGAYNLRLNRFRDVLVFGLNGGFTQKTINADGLQWGSQYQSGVGYDPSTVPSLGLINDKITFPSFGAGIVWHHRFKSRKRNDKSQGHIGMSAANLNRPHAGFLDQDLGRSDIIYKADGIITYMVRQLEVSHAMLGIYAKERYHLNFGTYVTYPFTPSYGSQYNSLKLSAGAWYRWKDAVVLSTALQISQLSVAVSYDLNQSALDVISTMGGAYEVSLSYRIPQKEAYNRKYGIPLM